jgi:LacI family transcriptional regulator
MRHVALLIETSRSHGRAMIRGVRRYVAEHEPWSLYLELRALDSPPPAWLRRWQGDGILTRTASRRMAEVIRATGLPAVELRATKLGHGLPFVGIDNSSLGRLVADHLIEGGFRRFAIFTVDSERYFEERRANFIARIEDVGHPWSEFAAPARAERPADWERHQARLVAWVRSLDKPVGIFACTDQLGFWLLDACRRAGVAVPEEVAVVGVENDETLCLSASPPLSSVEFDSQRLGYAAARLLDSLMAGGQPPAGPLLLPPAGLEVRQSSDIVAIDDPQLAAAVRFIREHAARGATTADVLRLVPVSRRVLDRQMRAVLGRSIAAEIARVRFMKVKNLLAETDLPLAAIAERSGFAYHQSMAESFKRRFGLTPGEFRAEQQR